MINVNESLTLMFSCLKVSFQGTNFMITSWFEWRQHFTVCRTRICYYVSVFAVRHLTLERWICVCSSAVVVLSYLFVRDYLFHCFACHFFNVNVYVEYIYNIPQNCAIAWPRSYGRLVYNRASKVMDVDRKPEKKRKEKNQPVMECKSIFWAWFRNRPKPLKPLISLIPSHCWLPLLCTSCRIILGARAPGQAGK